MSLKKSIVASYASQAYVSAVGILILPYYLRLMGSEAYGLIGFFTLLQAWFTLLDFGLSATLSRETARLKGGAINANSLKNTLRALELIFFLIGITGLLLLWFSASYIAGDWLKINSLNADEVSQSIRIMAVIIVLRWAGGLSRGIITGFEQLVWLGGFGAAVATLRFILVVPVMLYFGATPSVFFWHQLLVAILEIAVLAVKSYALLPRSNSSEISTIDWPGMAPTLRFALGIAFLSVAWIIMTQTDKLLLSRLLSLPAYGHFTLAVLAAGAIMLAGGPISSALLPRLSRLHAEAKSEQRDALYRTATRLMAAMVLPVALAMAIFAEPIILAWTGNPGLAREIKTVLALYALGNGILVLAAFPYYLQYAHGDLKLHVYGSLFFLAMLIPGLIWATQAHGMDGAGAAWLATNLLYLLAWTPVVHRRFLAKRHLDWLLHDVLKPAFISSLVLLPLAVLAPPSGNRLILALQTGLYLGLALLATGRQGIKDWHLLSDRFPEAQERL